MRWWNSLLIIKREIEALSFTVFFSTRSHKNDSKRWQIQWGPGQRSKWVGTLPLTQGSLAWMGVLYRPPAAHVSHGLCPRKVIRPNPCIGPREGPNLSCPNHALWSSGGKGLVEVVLVVVVIHCPQRSWPPIWPSYDLRQPAGEPLEKTSSCAWNMLGRICCYQQLVTSPNLSGLLN